MDEQVWNLAEVNVARARAALDDPSMADFVAALDGLNRLADESPGFIWRLTAGDGQASSYVRVAGDDRLIVNLSVWSSVESLHAYTYRSHHHRVFRERRRWFERLERPSLALWWVHGDVVPAVDDALARLERLRAQGPTPEAFDVTHRFPKPSGV